MEALLLLGALATVAIVALHFGFQFRTSPSPAGPGANPSVVSSRHLTHVNANPAGTFTGELNDARVMWAPPPVVRYPLLQAIDLGCGPGHVSFARDRDAASLEIRAQAWANAHWAESTWLTGRIRQEQFDTLCAELEHEREARNIVIHGLAVPPMESSAGTGGLC